MLINIAFCFDENIAEQVKVTVASLLDHGATQQEHYHIYCICTKEAAYIEETLRRIVERRDQESSLTVKVAENLYQNAYEVRGISTGTYLRLMLHRLLPEVDRLIYADVDVLFQDHLSDLWQTDMTDCVLAAVKGGVNLSDKWEWNSDRPYWKHLEGMQGRYINAGVVLMDLAKIRRRNLEKQWNEWAKEKLYYQDQDILNITCQNAIRYVSPRYNRLAYLEEKDYDRLVSEGIFTLQECEEAMHHPAILHYTGDKPWKRYDTNLGPLWWNYVNSQPDLIGLFDEETARRYHGPTIWERGTRKLKKLFSREKL
ncbi:MAG: glycosyltransferase family 8 protein [Lachnospiraceae bacterium]|nr:glycosyltransferase family 8 protein [Lachnospiraceae bacterium]